MDFSSFKSITIEGNDVTKLEIDGNIVWQSDTGTTEEYSGITCVYNIETTGSTQLFNGASYPSEMYVDDVKVSPNSFYTFTTTGEHTVKFGWTTFYNRHFEASKTMVSAFIGSGVTSLSDSRDMFKECRSLSSVTVSDKNTYFDSRDNCNAVILTASNRLLGGCKNTTIPNTVTALGASSLCYLGITSITIPDSVTSLHDWALAGNNFTSIVIPDTVTSVGENILQDCTYLETLKTNIVGVYFCRYDTSLKTLELGDGVTSIGAGAFQGCTSLASVTIPDSVTEIGSGAFFNCTALTSIVIPDTVTSIGNSVFYSCSSLTSATLSNNITTIPQSLFSYCSNLASITIPSGVTRIAGEAFRECSSLATSITIPSGVTNIGSMAFYNCKNITTVYFNNTREVWNNEVSKGSEWSNYIGTSYVICTDGEADLIKLYSITGTFTTSSDGNTIKLLDSTSGIYRVLIDGEEQSSVTSRYKIANAGSHTFELKTDTFDMGTKFSYTNIDTVTLPEGVIRLESKAFQYSDVKTVTLPSTMSSLYAEAFYHCENFTGITIPANVTTIEKRFAPKCPNFVSLVIDENNSKYDSRDNCNAVIETASNTLTYSCASTTIPSTVTALGDGAFDDNNGLKTITIPDTIKSIGTYTFSYTSAMTDCVIEAEISEFPQYTWSGCFALERLTLPGTTTYIDYQSFDNCVVLREIHFNGTTEQWLKVNIYSWGSVPSDVKIYCTDGTVDRDGNVTPN